jgi:hypothetical protein
VRRHGRTAEIAAPPELRWKSGRLLLGDREVSFVVNRSTDFFFEGEELAALAAAYHARCVCVAPNPFSYATRSDKALLAFLSHADSDARLGIGPDERAVLAAHVPGTRVVREEDVERIAARRDELVVKPAHGYAGHGLLDRSQVGRSRLRRLLRKSVPYVAQERVPKARLATESGVELWADLRVWAYRGECFRVGAGVRIRIGSTSRRPAGGCRHTCGGIRRRLGAIGLAAVTPASSGKPRRSHDGSAAAGASGVGVLRQGVGRRAT